MTLSFDDIVELLIRSLAQYGRELVAMLIAADSVDDLATYALITSQANDILAWLNDDPAALVRMQVVVKGAFMGALTAPPTSTSVH